jgi:hypothetical protein
MHDSRINVLFLYLGTRHINSSVDLIIFFRALILLYKQQNM